MTHKLLLSKAPAAGGGAFDPETDITWHSLFWAEGTDFKARGYADGADATTWDNETGEADADDTTATAAPTFNASDAVLNYQPSVEFSNAAVTSLATPTFTIAPNYSAGISIVTIAKVDATGVRALFDGIGGRNHVYQNSTDFRVFAGSFWTTTGVIPGTTDPFLLVATFGGAGTDLETLTFNGGTTESGQAGTAQITRLMIGAQNSGANTWQGPIALMGIYEGDIATDPAWADFEVWAADHYGITIA